MSAPPVGDGVSGCNPTTDAGVRARGPPNRSDRRGCECARCTAASAPLAWNPVKAARTQLACCAVAERVGASGIPGADARGRGGGSKWGTRRTCWAYGWVGKCSDARRGRASRQSTPRSRAPWRMGRPAVTSGSWSAAMPSATSPAGRLYACKLAMAVTSGGSNVSCMYRELSMTSDQLGCWKVKHSYRAQNGPFTEDGGSTAVAWRLPSASLQRLPWQGPAPQPCASSQHTLSRSPPACRAPA
eukprot:scaffold7506_cov376-Prasinococcus_capsulatus_cf.AAC.3